MKKIFLILGLSCVYKMKKNIIIILLLSLANTLHCQEYKSEFEDYAKKFSDCNFPINFEIDIYNCKTNITKNEFDIFVKKDFTYVRVAENDTSSFWKYKMYSPKKSTQCYFEYVSACKFKISETKIALIHWQIFLGINMDERYETILTIFDLQGEKISEISLNGWYHGYYNEKDTLLSEIYYSSVINNERVIETTYNISSWDKGEIAYKKYHQITEDGRIEEIQK